MSIHRLEELTWMEVADLDRSKTIVWIPISPIEEHGPHLPLGTDLFGARDMAEMAAGIMVAAEPSLNAVLAPAIPLGGCRITADFPGTISVRGTTLVRVVTDVCAAFAQNDFRYIVLANHHLDPVHMKAILTAIDELADCHPDLRIIEILSRVAFTGAETEAKARLRDLGLDPEREIHADARETAYIRFKYPHLLKPQADGLPPVAIDIQAGLRKGYKTFKQMGAEMGYLGTPAAATEDLGRLHLEENAHLAADLALKMARAEDLPEVPAYLRDYFDKHVHLD